MKALKESGADFSYAPVSNLDEKTNSREIIYPKISNVFFSIVPLHQTMFVRGGVIVKE